MASAGSNFKSSRNCNHVPYTHVHTHTNTCTTVPTSSLNRSISVKRSQQLSQYHYVSGQVIEVDGLKGELDHLELYIKVRLNIHPMHQRQQKFSRGPVIHKTRTLRGSTRPQWKEDFMVTGLLVANRVGGIFCLGDVLKY